MAKEAQDIKVIKLGGFCSVLGMIVIIAMVYAATVFSPWFRWDGNALSQLGIGEQAPLFNSAVIVGGVFLLFFALGLKQFLPRKTLNKIGVTLILTGSVCLALVGVFTVEQPLLHVFFALGFFVLSPLGLILIGKGVEEDKGFRVLTMASGITALIVILVLPFPLSRLGAGFAVPEMVHALILGTWTIFMGKKLIQHKP